MNVSFKLGKPEGFLAKMVPDRFKANSPEAELSRWSGRLSDDARGRLESSLNDPVTPQEQAETFSSTVSDLQGKEDPRSLYAATVLGLRNLDEKIDSPLIDVTKAAVGSAEYATDTAIPQFLNDLTGLAVKGLHRFHEQPGSSPLLLAADFEDSVGYLARDMAPALTQSSAGIEPHAEVYSQALRATEIPSGDFLRKLDQHPNAPLAQTLHTVLTEELSHGGDAWDVSDVLDRVGAFEPTPPIADLVDRSYETFSAQGVDALMGMLEKESQG